MEVHLNYDDKQIRTIRAPHFLYLNEQGGINRCSNLQVERLYKSNQMKKTLPYRTVCPLKNQKLESLIHGLPLSIRHTSFSVSAVQTPISMVAPADAKAMMYACAAASCSWQWRMLGLMAENQMLLMNRLNHLKIPRRCRSCGLRSRRLNDKQSDVDTTATDEESSSSSQSSNIDNDERGITRQGVKRRSKPSKDLNFWDEVLISCEVNHEYETQLVNHLLLLSTSSLPTSHTHCDDPAQISSENAQQRPPPDLPHASAVHDEPTQEKSETTETRRRPHIDSIDLSASPLPCWDGPATLFRGVPLLAQLEPDIVSDILSHVPTSYGTTLKLL